MTPDSIKASYRRALGAFEEIVIRRYTGAGANRPYFDAPVLARVTGYEPKELVGTIQQGDRKLIVLADDLIAAQVPLDLKKGDKAVVRGKELNIEAADDSTRRVAGVLIAYELQVRG
ncbi:hypothetical protein [Allomesorhizobium alhagi]|uniref:Uncharacterized protein n=1 Tax=Mesorhizobium alhagi CCNWXJ12-2 TaxID=1107882 RepID=H0HQU1_9HYPH|nr:hypothetical protein [Mesorhizobium alhagi]EHK56905.1 hypothetical protein MAXJ12_12607 [Mesorhizobium alhagi CCNWXJ12-2]